MFHLGNLSHSLTSVDVLIDVQKGNALKDSEKKHIINREIMKRLIEEEDHLEDTMKVLTVQKKDFFLEIIYFLKKYDPVMKQYLEAGPKNSTYLSIRIQNDLINHYMMFFYSQFAKYSRKK
ncbi:hypothetical protein PR048_009324 [Dryococelus australis]|uniref:Uncharacterized protein n=1 Tax=Dryococelus australis TaxID=614101 RepID=A0ABQ9HZI8_9NEOP|nr:hypothetical protein PR048_009324 [Dryococelus australis]